MSKGRQLDTFKSPLEKVPVSKPDGINWEKRHEKLLKRCEMIQATSESFSEAAVKKNTVALKERDEALAERDQLRTERDALQALISDQKAPAEKRKVPDCPERDIQKERKARRALEDASRLERLKAQQVAQDKEDADRQREKAARRAAQEKEDAALETQRALEDAALDDADLEVIDLDDAVPGKVCAALAKEDKVNAQIQEAAKAMTQEGKFSHSFSSFSPFFRIFHSLFFSLRANTVSPSDISANFRECQKGMAEAALLADPKKAERDLAKRKWAQQIGMFIATNAMEADLVKKETAAERKASKSKKKLEGQKKPKKSRRKPTAPQVPAKKKSGREKVKENKLEILAQARTARKEEDARTGVPPPPRKSPAPSDEPPSPPSSDSSVEEDENLPEPNDVDPDDDTRAPPDSVFKLEELRKGEVIVVAGVDPAADDNIIPWLGVVESVSKKGVRAGYLVSCGSGKWVRDPLSPDAFTVWDWDKVPKKSKKGDVSIVDVLGLVDWVDADGKVVKWSEGGTMTDTEWEFYCDLVIEELMDEGDSEDNIDNKPLDE
jgi:hypothetical protein